MTIDKSLKVRAGGVSTRSVLTREERIKQLLETERFSADENSPFGLPKVRVRKLQLKKKKKKAKEDDDK